MVEPAARFEQIKIPLADSAQGLSEVSGVLGVPRWWPTGARVSICLAHGARRDHTDPLIESLHRELTERQYLTLRFNFPFAEAKKRRPDSMQVLGRTFRAAIEALSRDPTAAPAHLFIGGVGLGGQVAAELAGSRVRVDGLFLLGFPLHPQGKPDELKAEELFRIVSPVLFLQGSRDRSCDLDVLRRTLLRVGAPSTLRITRDADHQFKVLKKSGRTPDEVQDELMNNIDTWVQKILED